MPSYTFSANVVPSFDICTFYTSNGGQIIKTIDGADKYLTPSNANVEYNSPVVGESFTESGDYYTATYDDGKRSVHVSKVFKPRNCTYISLESRSGEYCRITFNENEKDLISVITITDKTELSVSGEIVAHLIQNEHWETKGGFLFQSHEGQVNGSNFEVSWSDILEINKSTNLGYDFNSMECGQCLLMRDYSKYFIGSWSKKYTLN